MSDRAESQPRRPTQSAAPRHTTWRPQAGRLEWLTGRGTRRGLVTFLALVLIATLAVLLVGPFLHPRPHLIAVGGPEPRWDRFGTAAFRAATPYAQQDDAALTGLAPLLEGRQSAQGIRQLTYDAPADLHTLHEWIAELASGRRDVLIVWANGRGVTHESTPYLALPPGTNPDAVNRVAVRQMIDELAGCPAGVKLLIVNAPPPSFASPTSVVNPFPTLVRQAVEGTGDRRLWVLLSHSTGEQSHAAPALRQSVFGAFVSRGLLGGADLDDDRIVSVDELFRYVAANVSDRVRRTTGGSTAQHPRLFWGGGSVDVATAAAAILVPVSDGKTATNSSATGKNAVARPPGDRARSVAAVSRASAPAITAGAVPKPMIVPPRLPTTSTPSAATNVARNPTANSDLPSGTAAKAASSAAKPTPATANPQTAKSSQDKTSAGNSAKKPSKPSNPAQKSPPQATDAATSVPSSSAAQSPADLLAQAWQLRDELESADANGRPIDYAPQLWRLFQEQLIALERAVRTRPRSSASPSAEQAGLAATLRRTVEALTALQAGSEELAENAPEILQKIHAGRPRIAIDVARLHSIGMAQRMAHPLPANIATTTGQFDALLKTGSREDVQKWSKKLPSDLKHFSEFQLALALLPLVDVEWETLRLALRVRRLAEQVAANPWTTDPPFRAAIDRADRFRRAGERILLDRIGRDRGPAAREQLEEADRLYRQVLADVHFLESIARLQRELTFRAPWYVAWYRTAGTRAGAPQFADLLSFLKTLRAMTVELYGADSEPGEADSRKSAVVDQFRTDEVAALRRLALRLRNLQAAIEAGLDRPMVSSLTALPILPGDGWRIESLLTTPLPASGARSRLLNRIDAIHATIADRLRPPAVASHAPTTGALAFVDWRRLKRVSELERELLLLAADPLSGHEEILAGVQTETDRLGRFANQRLVETTPDAAEAMRVLRDFESAMENAYEKLATRIHQDLSAATAASKPSGAKRIHRLQTARHALRASAAADAGLRDLGQSAAELRRLQWIRLAQHQRDRALAAREDAPPSELLQQTASAANYQKLAQRLSERTLTTTDEAIEIDVNAPTTLSLIAKDRAPLDVTIASVDAEPNPAWIVLDYDPGVLRVEPQGRQTVYREDLLRDELRARVLEGAAGKPPTRSAEYPLRPDLASLRSTLNIPAGSSAVLPLSVRKLPGAKGPARLVIKAVAGGHVARHEIEVALPRTNLIDLRIAGISNSWSEVSSSDRGDGGRSAGLLTLNPFPNQTTNYQLSLVNTGSKGRTVAVELFALSAPTANAPRPTLSSLPHGDLPTSAAGRILEDLDLTTPLLSIPKVVLPSGGVAVPIPFPKLPQKESGPKGAKSPASNAASGPDASSGGTAAATASSALAKVDDGILLVVRDPQSDRVLLKPIGVLPQRPRRFLRVSAAYDSRQQRVEVTVRAEDPARLPAKGIPLRLEFARALPKDADRRLEAVLAPPGYEAQLYASVPSESGRVETIFISGAGVPRAFSYRIDCDAESYGAADVADETAIRITSPSGGAAYAMTRETIPVDLQIDAPLGAFGTADAFVEVGIDADQDGELQGESPLRLRSDRQVETAVATTTPDGGLAIATRIGDVSLSLPVVGVAEGRANLLARVHLGEHSVWSRAVEVVFDGSEPRVDQIRLNPGERATLGKPVAVLVEASDAGLSGVASVEIAIDVQHNGRFGTKPPPTPARRDDQGQWRAVLDTSKLKPGTYTVLARATDRVGHVSETGRARMEIITPQQAAAMQKAAAVTRISGVVLFGGEPAANIDVTLTSQDEKGPKFDAVQSDANGAFAFTPVPPGKYSLKASGVIHNKTRTATAAITVGPKPKAITTLDLKLE